MQQRKSGEKCTICERRFISKAALKYHLLAHGQSKPYKCSFCPFQTSFPWNSKRHEMTHHREKSITKRVENVSLSSFSSTPIPIPSTPITMSSFQCHVGQKVITKNSWPLRTQLRKIHKHRIKSKDGIKLGKSSKPSAYPSQRLSINSKRSLKHDNVQIASWKAFAYLDKNRYIVSQESTLITKYLAFKALSTTTTTNPESNTLTLNELDNDTISSKSSSSGNSVSESKSIDSMQVLSCPVKDCNDEFYGTKFLLLHIRHWHSIQEPLESTAQTKGKKFTISSRSFNDTERSSQSSSSTRDLEETETGRTKVGRWLEKQFENFTPAILPPENSISDVDALALLRDSSDQSKASDRFKLNCPVDRCPYTAFTDPPIRAHIKRQHPDPGRFKCKHCLSVWTVTALDLLKHIRRHDTERPYRCHYSSCTMRFRTKKSKSRHESSSHSSHFNEHPSMFL